MCCKYWFGDNRKSRGKIWRKMCRKKKLGSRIAGRWIGCATLELVGGLLGQKNSASWEESYLPFPETLTTFLCGHNYQRCHGCIQHIWTLSHNLYLCLENRGSHCWSFFTELHSCWPYIFVRGVHQRTGVHFCAAARCSCTVCPIFVWHSIYLFNYEVHFFFDK